ncbi:MAG: peptidylprolyl isomerase [Leptolyngbya sp. SIO4C1]|nr:peptidylprolyl isomerase [Leptolyngbya sp. SIO4C1]
MRLGFGRQCAVWLVAIAVLLSSCTSRPPETAETPESAEPAEVAVEPALDDVAADLPRLDGQATVELLVNGETIVIEVDGTQAPLTAGNFVDLVQRGVYDGTVFHRVVKTPQPFVVQGGDPQSTDPNVPASQLGTGSFVNPETGQPRYIPLEILPSGAETPVYSQTFETAGIAEPPALTHTRGAVAMARSQFPDSASAQFYIALADLPFLDGSYAVFGQVTEGMDVVDAIEQDDVIESAQVVAGLDNLQPPEAASPAADSDPEPAE